MKYEMISIRTTIKKYKITHPFLLDQFLKRYTKSRQEQFLVITLDGAHQVIGIHIATIGLNNMTVVHPREVFIHAIRDNAAAIITAHNHPSNNTKPSDNDLQVARMLTDAGEIIGIRVIDHLIITKDDYLSFKKDEIVF